MNEIKEVKRLYDKLLSSDLFFFPIKGAVKVSSKHGVYIITDPDGKVLHVGRASSGKEGLNQRLQNHLKNQSSFSKHYLKPKNINLREGFKFRYIEIENGRIRALLENLATGILCPLHLGTGEKIL